MPNWQQELLEMEETQNQRRQGLDLPFGMTVESVSSDSELMKVTYFGNHDRTIYLNHPFMSNGSWLRAIPENGARLVGTFRSDETQPQQIGYGQRQTYFRTDSFRKGQGLYRPMYPGEIEISSVGGAQTYYTRRPIVETRAGSIVRWADQDQLTAGDRAPIHRRQFFNYVSGTLGDEQRIGIIQRPATSWSYSYPQVRDNYAAEEYIHMLNPAKESPVVLFEEQRGHVLDEEGEQIQQQITQIPLRYVARYYANDDTSTDFEIDEKGNYLVQLADAAVEGYELRVPSGNYKKSVELNEIIQITGHREDSVGEHVVETVGTNYTMTVGQNLKMSSDDGGQTFMFDATSGAEKIVMSTASGHLLVFDDTSGSEAVYIIHNTGSQLTFDTNGSIKMVSAAGNFIFLDDESGSLTLTSKSGAFVTCKEDVTFADSTGKNVFTFGGSTLQFSSSSDVVIAAQKVSINGGAVNVGANASFSAVLGEQLASYISAHQHATPIGPTSPPIIPPSVINSNPATSFLSTSVKVKGNLPA